jgi:hypothetical protein
MFLGWILAALVLGGLFLAGSLAGVIGRNGYAGAVFPARARAEKPVPVSEAP